MKQITLEGIRKPIFPLIMGSDFLLPNRQEWSRICWTNFSSLAET